MIRRVIVPTVPDADLSANSRAHYMVKAKKVSALRETAGWAALSGAPSEPIEGPVSVRAEICWPKFRKRQDRTNVEHCLKAIIDGMTDAGWWRDDRLVTIERPIVQQTWGEWSQIGGASYPAGCVVIDVEEDAA